MVKPEKSVSKSTYRAILGVEKERDELSGLYIRDRYFDPDKKEKGNEFLWYILDFFTMSLVLTGLFLLVTSGFSLSAGAMSFLILQLIVLGTLVIFRNEWSNSHRFAVGLFLLITYFVVVFILQERIQSGAGQLLNHIIDTLNNSYKGELEMKGMFAAADDSVLVLLVVMAPIAFFLAASLFWINERLLSFVVVFPILILAGLCGAAKNTFALFTILIGMLLCITYTGTKRQRRMWGGKKKELFDVNRTRFLRIRFFTALVVLASAFIFSIPGYLLVRPFLSFSLTPMEKISSNVQNEFLNRMLTFLPNISAGQWNLKTETQGGGVSDGKIENTDGYLLDEIEDLKITISRKPAEAVILKGFVGSIYENGGWVGNSGTTFDGAAMNWNTDQNARIYIQNLPFLRTAYVENQSDLLGSGLSGADGNGEAEGTSNGTIPYVGEPISIQIERINANDEYTYVPYGTYLNAYYEVEDGDGSVKGQTETDDIYFFFDREDMEKVLSAWNSLEDTENVLDRVEDLYASFCEKQYLSVGMIDGEEALQEMIDQVKADNKWKLPEDIDEVTAWIRRYMVENYSYNITPKETPAGEDPLKYFAFESKEGNSVQFASLAVLMYRMFGVPARYVVGYEMPELLFVPQADGAYSAVAQGDNSQAFAEIYKKGIGWLPEDMTPGVIGTIEEVGPGGIPIEFAKDEDDGEETDKVNDKKDPEISQEKLPDVRNPIIERLSALTMGEIIAYLAGILAATALLVTAGIITAKLTHALGFSPILRKPKEERSLMVFQAIYRRLGRMGLEKEAGSDDEAFAQFYRKGLEKAGKPGVADAFEKAVDALYECCYGDVEAKEQDIVRLRKVLIEIYKVPKKYWKE